ncbi:hypothetical protein Mkiyose1665_07350 [Mycobacterium kiyosense]|uniref:RNA-binding protein n=2 Tax=Mycobacteriaceae TaxID=1762 RepID=A0A9P3Q299_9MYCO|nr:hypothetical protein IWGMT90018_28990 [Mycobacterium kiyosense]BDE14284.1 hypothetical protein MKCMC460_31440 [Mycobacterium sp. 20KCMC460]GLB81500.1 hypothetical protein SRL2020028_07560 [Mycobacterium kiyosense]GLB93693.1 hypothetical protein SRL2020226_04690 [Mycobacterium kiyosense]GLC00167.1 hypothetical protein SRL2020400_07580 [Mycobacterium kiyosense]
MNVIGSRPDGWWKDRRRAMAALVESLQRWAPETDRVTVVFERPPEPPLHSSVIEVAHAPQAAANSADDEIVRLVQDLILGDVEPGEIRVVTSDKALADRVGSLGASVHRAERFRDVIDPRCAKPERRHDD